MYYKFSFVNNAEMKNYIAIFSFYKYEKIMIEPYYILAECYEKAINEAGTIKEIHREFKLECLIELDIIPNKENIIIDFDLGKEKGDKGEPGMEPVNNMTYWNVSKKKNEFKFCPFRFDNNGGMCRCVGHTCMAYIVDRAKCSPYCARLKERE